MERKQFIVNIPVGYVLNDEASDFENGEYVFEQTDIKSETSESPLLVATNKAKESLAQMFNGLIYDITDPSFIKFKKGDYDYFVYNRDNGNLYCSFTNVIKPLIKDFGSNTELLCELISQEAFENIGLKVNNAIIGISKYII